MTNGKTIWIASGSAVGLIGALTAIVTPTIILKAREYTDHRIDRHNVHKHTDVVTLRWMRVEIKRLETHLLMIEKKVDKLDSR